MVTSSHVTKMVVTPLNPPWPKIPRYTQTSLLYVWPFEVLHCRNMDFGPLSSCDLDLDPM